jgi:hypothetical protein
MPYLICKKCDGYYKLQEGESLEDFEECECGGELIQVDSLNIPYNTERVKTIIETFSKDKQATKEKSNGPETSKKLSITVDYTDGLHRLLKDDKAPKKDIPIEVLRSMYREVALIPEFYNIDYLDYIDDETFLKIMEILAETIYEGRGAIDASDKIHAQTDLTEEEAEKISKNELNRIKNLGNWYVHKEKGFKYFKITKALNACGKCNQAYDKKKFSIKQADMLPPLHDLCTCNAIFYRE